MNRRGESREQPAQGSPNGANGRADLWSAAGSILAMQTRVPRLGKCAGEEPAPLSFAQERLWALEQTEPGAAYYNIPFTWLIHGELNVGALEKSLAALIVRHAVLRTSFPLVAGAPLQRVTAAQFELKLEDVSTFTNPTAEAQRQARELAGKPFDLEHGPLFRVVLYKRGESDFWLVMVVHQMVFDGGSMRIFTRELGDCYRSFAAGTEPKLETVPVQYTDFSTWQRQILKPEVVVEDEAFWSELLGTAYEPLRLPTDRERRNFGITQGTQIPFSISKAVMARLRSLSAEAGGTSFAAFLATFQSFLAKLTAQDDVLTLVSIAARNVPEVRNLVGLVANVLPMRLELPPKATLRQAIEYAGEMVANALAHQSLPLSRILEKLSTSGDAAGAPALQTLVIYNNAPLPSLKMPEVTFTPLLDLDNGTAKFDLLLEVWDSPAGLNGHLKYRSDLFEPTTIDALLTAWKQFVEETTGSPDKSMPAITISRQKANDTPLIMTRTASASYVAPRTELEGKLAAIWAEVFGVERVGVNDNFFGLGGHSLVAVKLINAIEQETGHKLRLCKIFSEPTVARLARTMEESGGRVGTSIVEIQPRGSKEPLYLVHGVGGGMFWGYNNLAHHLGEEQPVYAFKSRGMDGLEEFTSIEAMAAQYVADLKKFQPAGPYHLGGYCFGGNVAFEMARQLKSQGQEVGLLLLMNCWPNNSSYTQMTFSPDVIAKGFWNFCFRMGHQLHWGVRHPVDFFKARSRWAYRRLRAIFTNDPLDRIAVEDVVDLASRPAYEQQLWRTHVESWLKYLPGTYDGQIALLRTRGHPLVCSFDHQMGWGAYAKQGVLVRTCPGDHDSILEVENVAHAAREVKTLLDSVTEARQAAQTGPRRDEIEVYRLSPGPAAALQGAACLSSVAIPAATCLPELAKKISL